MTVEVTDPDPSDAVQETFVPPVSCAMVVGGQVGVDQVTVTSSVCHAPQSLGPGEHDG
jgi:hypothetical protein